MLDSKSYLRELDSENSLKIGIRIDRGDWLILKNFLPVKYHRICDLGEDFEDNASKLMELAEEKIIDIDRLQHLQSVVFRIVEEYLKLIREAESRIDIQDKYVSRLSNVQNIGKKDDTVKKIERDITLYLEHVSPGSQVYTSAFNILGVKNIEDYQTRIGFLVSKYRSFIHDRIFDCLVDTHYLVSIYFEKIFYVNSAERAGIHPNIAVKKGGLDIDTVFKEEKPATTEKKEEDIDDEDKIG